MLLAHALVLWGLCAATFAIARSLTSLETALIVHAVAAPILAAMVSTVYFEAFDLTSPLVTALVVLAVVALVDLLVVALLINRSLDMFRSVLGTWLPFALIFVQTIVTGVVVRRTRKPRVAR